MTQGGQRDRKQPDRKRLSYQPACFIHALPIFSASS
jgi:hypothetical protein